MGQLELPRAIRPRSTVHTAAWGKWGAVRGAVRGAGRRRLLSACSGIQPIRTDTADTCSEQDGSLFIFLSLAVHGKAN